MLQQWFIEEFVNGPYGLDNPNIDGFFCDDQWSILEGASEEDSHHIEDPGLSLADVKSMVASWRENQAAVVNAVARKGGLLVNYFQTDGWDGTDSKTNCAQDLRRLCAVNETTGRPNIHDQVLLQTVSNVGHHEPWYPNGTLPYFEQDLATFLLVRGPYAWIGYARNGCTDEDKPPGCNPQCQAVDCNPCQFPKARDSTPFTRLAALDDDYGEPVHGESCQETSPASGIFRRKWTKVEVELDCKKFAATITKRKEVVEV